MMECKTCGAPLINENDRFCSECGAMIQEPSIDENDTLTETKEETIADVPIVSAGSSDHEDYRISDDTPAQSTTQSTESSHKAAGFPDTSGQKAFSIVMIVVSGLLFCCSGILSLPFAIIALVYVLGAEKAQDIDTAQYKIRTALILNCVSAGVLFLGLLISFVARFFTSFFQNMTW